MHDLSAENSVMVTCLSISFSKDARLLFTKMMCKTSSPRCMRLTLHTQKLETYIAIYRYIVSPYKYPGMWYTKLSLTASNYFHFALFLGRAGGQKGALIFDTGIT